MSSSAPSTWGPKRLLAVAATMASSAFADNILQTVGLTNCGPDSAITVQKADISYDQSSQVVTFDLAGNSKSVQNVTAVLKVTAYGNEIFSDSFDPCDSKNFIDQLCPVPSGNFGAKGNLTIPDEFVDMVPDIAFKVPDIAALAKMELLSRDDDEEVVACVQSQVSNGKTANVPAVSYVAAGIAGAALVASGIGGAASALSGGSTGGSGTPSPSFTETIGWFQGLAMNGMLSVDYPPVYRSFTKNFAFSTGLIPWTDMLVGIDNFRDVTGGNLTRSSVEVLRNTTLVFSDGSTIDGKQAAAGALKLKVKRSLEQFGMLVARQVDTSVGDSDSSDDDGDNGGFQKQVEGLQAFAEQLSVPEADMFLTILLILAIAIAAIVVGILLVKVVLELWALFGSFPKSLVGFRTHYWGTMGRAITTLILLLYGIWVIYCVFQFNHGDSWAAQTLAGVTLAIFTALLAFFSFKIWNAARKLKQAEGDSSGLYEKKEVWVKYSLFYESYKKDYWWVFMPLILYMLAKGIAIGAGSGNGLAQTSAHIAIEAAFLVLLLWKRPFERKSGNVINIMIQVVRVLSVVCILVFVERFGIAQTTQTVTGVVLIAIQSALTGLLAILICWNAINNCCKMNPHRKRRKEAEKRQREEGDLTPLDARNSLLIDRKDPAGPNGETTYAMSSTVEKQGSNVNARDASPEPYDSYRGVDADDGHGGYRSNGYRALTSNYSHDRAASGEGLVGAAAPVSRQPTVPDMGNDGYRGYGAYRGY